MRRRRYLPRVVEGAKALILAMPQGDFISVGRTTPPF